MRRRHFCVSLCLYLGLAVAVMAVARAEARDIGPDIEVCFVLDTTGSMADLIDGARQKMWAIANAVARLEPQPSVSFCLMGFRDRGDEYVTRLTDITPDMDRIYADLRAFVAAGGGDEPEAVGQALYETLTRVGWSHDDATIRVIYLAGDAPPHTDYPDEMALVDVLALARSRGIVINAIQCGDSAQTTHFWRRIASDGAGRYARVARRGAVTVQRTPLDQDFVALQGKLAATIVPWGDAGRRERIADAQTSLAGLDDHVVADRLSFVARVGRLVEGEGDLVADVAAGHVDLKALHDDALPASLRGLQADERAQRLAELALDRQEYLRVIGELATERGLLLRADLDDPSSFDGAVIEQIKALAAERGYTLR